MNRVWDGFKIALSLFLLTCVSSCIGIYSNQVAEKITPVYKKDIQKQDSPHTPKPNVTATIPVVDRQDTGDPEPSPIQEPPPEPLAAAIESSPKQEPFEVQTKKIQSPPQDEQTTPLEAEDESSVQEDPPITPPPDASSPRQDDPVMALQTGTESSPQEAPSLPIQIRPESSTQNGVSNDVKDTDEPPVEAVQTASVQEEQPQPANEQAVPSEQDDQDIIEPMTPTNQELIDSALDYCQTANEFWEQGDLDNAIDALDKAYSLTLKVEQNDDPEVLQQKEDLRFTISKRIIEVYSSRFTVATGNHKAIPVVMNKYVKRALKLFQGNERQFFLESYHRSGKYRPAIVAALKEAGLPEELSWLPFIESGFKVRALSKARALGMWQFIASTGYKYGLKRDRYIDERMDPAKSTEAAIAYLSELHRIFGDWTTVMAAYNCGEGTVLKRIRTQQINYLDNFWDLYEKLPRETAFYVPKFLAFLHILNDPEAHGFTLPDPDQEMAFETVTTDKHLHLKTIAKTLGVDYTSLKNLNPELRLSITPNTHYALKVPKGTEETRLAALSDLPAWKPPVPTYVVHRVRRGESLSVIAEKYRTSIRAIMEMNGLKSRHYLKVGWRLKIPTRRSYAKQAPTSTQSIPRVQGEIFRYTVRKGDSLWLIANRYKTTTKAIQSLNRLTRTTLQVGQVLLISPGRTTSDVTYTKNYQVKDGDSPYLIAKKHQMNLYDFLHVNNLTPRSTIYPGQVVQVIATLN
jgi:membrane-bound lytic murein transglycosylase D